MTELVTMPQAVRLLTELVTMPQAVPAITFREEILGTRSTSLRQPNELSPIRAFEMNNLGEDLSILCRRKRLEIADKCRHIK